MPMMQTRRRFLTTLSLASAAGLLRPALALAMEGPLETTTVRLARVPGTCFAPQFVAEELLHAEGFTDIRYMDATNPTSEPIARGKVDFSLGFASPLIIAIDAGEPIMVLGGVMVGCVELFASEGIRNIAELKGKSVGVSALGATPHVVGAIMAANVGLDPTKDIRWVVSPSAALIGLFADGRIDAFISGPPESQELHARHIGHVILNIAVDRPWSQYFCCALRLREVGFISSSPQKIIADGTDWRFFDELKREPKA